MTEVVIMEITNENKMNNDSAIVQASMSQVEMTVWLCIMAVLAIGMLAILAIVE